MKKLLATGYWLLAKMQQSLKGGGMLRLFDIAEKYLLKIIRLSREVRILIARPLLFFEEKG
jgi:hypothetical protein